MLVADLRILSPIDIPGPDSQITGGGGEVEFQHPWFRHPHGSDPGARLPLVGHDVRQ
jgi:hypothetical protein